MKHFKQITWVFIKKDWFEFRKTIALLTCGSLLPIAAIETDLAKGMIAGLLLAVPFIYAHSCFRTERQHGTLEFLLTLPLTHVQLVLAKYASLFSMTLFTVNLPGLFQNDFRLLLYANLAALFFGTVCMAAAVVSDKLWAAQLPLWVVAAILPFYRSISLAWIATHATLLAATASLLIPATILLSAWIFASEHEAGKHQRGV